MVNRDDTKFSVTAEGKAINDEDSAKYLDDLNVSFGFRLVQIIGRNTYRTLDKSDYHGYLDVNVFTETWVYDPEKLASTSNYS